MHNVWWVETQTHTHTLWNDHYSKLTSPSFQLFLGGGENTQHQPYQTTPRMVTAPPRHRRKTRVIVPGAICPWTRSCKWVQVPAGPQPWPWPGPASHPHHPITWSQRWSLYPPIQSWPPAFWPLASAQWALTPAHTTAAFIFHFFWIWSKTLVASPASAP